MPHRRRALNLNPTLLPPPPPPAAAFHHHLAAAADDTRLPLLAADYALLQPSVSADEAPAAPTSAEWSAGSAFTAASSDAGATTATASSTATAPGSLTTAAEDGGRDTWVRRAREGYYLQLSLAIRLTSQAFLAGAPAPPELLLGGCGTGDATDDPEAVSYRLWVRASIHICICYSLRRTDMASHTSI